MSFIPDNAVRGKTVAPLGSKDARICIVGDFVDRVDAANGRPFSGPAGTVLDGCLHAAGIIRQECYLTTVIKEPPSGRITDKKNGPFAEFWQVNSQNKGKFTEAGQRWVESLREELASVNANVLVAAGPAAFAALTGRPSGLGKRRGYVMPSRGLHGGPLPGGERKVIPTFAPESTLWKNYHNRTVINIDLKKARLESGFPELRLPLRQLVLKYDSVSEALEWIDLMGQGSTLSFDIEVVNYEVACISFSTSPDVGVVIPILDRWSEEEECLIWRAIQRILGNPDTVKVGQNLIFDIHFLLTRAGIEVRGPLEDTMIGHSVMFTELPKSLGFLGSIYCGSQPYWKDMVKFDDMKEKEVKE